MKRLILIPLLLALLGLACAIPSSDTAEQQSVPTFTDDNLSFVLTNIAALEEATSTSTEAPENTPTETTAPEEDAEEATATATKAAAEPESEESPTPTLTPTTAVASGFPTPIPLPNPVASDFHTCLTSCAADGSNHQETFPAQIEKIYFGFDFSEFPVGAPYSRAWYKDGVEWVRYDCYWPGPEAGIEEITLTEPNGLASGTWNVVITINGVQVINETLEIEGSWTLWDPPGHFNTCYGKR